MARFGFVGGSYTSEVFTADCQKTENLYPEVNESGQGKSAMTLIGTPGLKSFASLSGMKKGRASLEMNGRCFVVAEDYGQQKLYEISSAGAVVAPSPWTLGVAGTQPSLAYNNATQPQLLIASGGQVFVVNTVTGTLTDVSGQMRGPVSQVGFSDGFFIALMANSNFWQVSNALDGLTWNPTNASGISVFADPIVSMRINHREIMFHGPKKSVVYYNSGGALFPYDVIPGSFSEQGDASTFGGCLLDNSEFWWGRSELGHGIAWRAQGYNPQRVSTHAIEFAISQYPTIADAVSWAYQAKGHTFWPTYFPSANAGNGATWVYDAATSLWHERSSNVGLKAHLGNSHCFAFGKHLITDWSSGNVYEMSDTYYDDAGTLIQRRRRAPILAMENDWANFDKFELDGDVGLGPQPPLLDGANNPRDPEVCLRWSDDSGRTWSNEHWLNFGSAGEYRRMAAWWGLGATRKGRVFEVTMTDPIVWHIIDAYVDGAGFRSSERLTHQLRKMA